MNENQPTSRPQSLPPTAERAPARPSVVAYDAATLAAGLAQLLPDLRGRAMRLTGDHAQADDLVQDTIERALRFAPQYQAGTNLRAWVQQILFSVFVTRYRRQRREKRALRVLATDPCAWTKPESFPQPDSTARLTVTTEKAVASLPAGFRSVLLLVDMEQRSYREAATELGLPVGTVMSRLHRGRKMLASRLEEFTPTQKAA
jgi:RNA polymerase sigma-70 factor (ECF subfamily)